MERSLAKWLCATYEEEQKKKKPGFWAGFLIARLIFHSQALSSPSVPLPSSCILVFLNSSLFGKAPVIFYFITTASLTDNTP